MKVGALAFGFASAFFVVSLLFFVTFFAFLSTLF